VEVKSRVPRKKGSKAAQLASLLHEIMKRLIKACLRANEKKEQK